MTEARTTITLAFLCLLVPAVASASFDTFETGQVRPLAMSPDGSRLFAINTPDNRLEIFSLASGSPMHTGSVEVGLEPIAVAARTDAEVWVVNHLSDSVSIVDVASDPPRVVRTLLVGDEPRDIVFAGPGRNRAFITTAHRGQNSPIDPQLTTPGVGRADVWVFDALNLGAPLGGTPISIVTLFGDTPRALATDPSGETVYAAVFHSGNQTTTINEAAVCDGFDAAGPCVVHGVVMPGGLPGPSTNYAGVPAPETGLIVKYDKASGEWRDELGRNWNNAVRFNLPDLDVFAIDAMANPPVESRSWPSVGTILFNMAVNPVNGKVYVTNTEAKNEVRFEGPGIFGGSTVRGRLALARITVIDPAQPNPDLGVTPRHLNKHIDYDVVPSPPGTADRSLATPLEMAITSDGQTLYVAAFGSSKIGVFSTSELENDTFVPSASSHIEVSGGGPSGVLLDEARGRLYVLTRFDNSLSVIDTTTASEIAHLPLYNPEPPHVQIGRPVLYDARATSSNGEASCAACHIFGDFDSLAWDLGNPDDDVLPNLNVFRVGDPLGMSFPDHHPMKGPMTTQSLRGMANHGPMHWRGDRSGANDVPFKPFDAKAAFLHFIVAFEGLLGRSGPIPDQMMEEFADFILEVRYPPNPIRNLDNSLTPEQQAGRDFFFKPEPSDVFQTCNGCHVLNPEAGFFGSDGRSSFEFETQLLKIPHLRNMYQKVGMFGMPANDFINVGDNDHKGDQIRGFGFLHDGSVDTLFRFHNARVFNQVNPAGFPIPNPGGFPNGAPGDPQRRQVEAFMLVFDSNYAPIVGQQVTQSPASDVEVNQRVALLAARAAVGECDLVVRGMLGGERRGWYRLPNGTFQSDRSSEPPVSLATLQTQAGVPGQERTFTCVPPGAGKRIGVDRDEDGFFDRDELDAGTDPADPESFPGAAPIVTIRSSAFDLQDDPVPPFEPKKRKVRFRSAKKGQSPSGVVLPAAGGDGDPTQHGATLILYRADGTGDAVTIALPAARWKKVGPTAVKRWTYSDPKGVDGPVRAVSLSATALTLRGQGAGLFSLANAPQGAMALRLQLGTEVQFCASAPAKATGKPPTTAKTDTTAKFVGAPNTPAPLTCPPLPSVGSASRAFLVETSTLVDF